MSRIDEALKRAADGSLTGLRGIARVTEPPQAPDESTLEQYPREARLSGTLPMRPVASRPQPASAPAARPAPSPRRAGALVRGEGRLVGFGAGAVSLEQDRRLAATLDEAQAERGVKAVMVTSTAPREGKTLTVANLALTLAESYRRRVLVIDANLRRPALHELFGAGNDAGLHEILTSDRRDLPLVEVTPLLSVLPAGHAGPNPLAALASDWFRVLIEECTAQFDWVLLDTPPVGVLSDAQLLARLTHGAVFVIAAGATPFALVERAVNDIGRESIIGTVLNRVEERTIPAASYYGSYEPAGR